MNITQRYQQDLASGNIISDPGQAEMVERLMTLQQQLLARANRYRWPWQRKHKRTSILGMYLWGGVGAGKTYLMDIFFASLPIAKKHRIHFFHFMQQVHAELKKIQGHADPLEVIAQQWADKTKILCLDEFLVEDIGDAMLLAGLLKGLFSRGVCLMTTSNTPPDRLYEKGLQRQRFLPAIALLKANTQVVHIAVQRDYRLRTLRKRGVYFTPLGEKADHKMREIFKLHAHHGGEQGVDITIAKRLIPTRYVAEGIVWFDFNVICQTPRNTADYLEIAMRYPVVLVSNVPHIHSHETTKIIYLIHLVDILYDNGVELVISAAVPLVELYVVGPHYQTFQRTLSRLGEMQGLVHLTKRSSNPTQGPKAAYQH